MAAGGQRERKVLAMTSTATGAPTEHVRRGPGRPRHTDVEPRAYQAVIELFGRHGWSGLTLDSVATHSGIGKSSIYLRWKTKHDLLAEAVRDFESKHDLSPDEDLPLREYLIAYGVARGRALLGEAGPTMLNIVAAAVANPEEFQELRAELIDDGVLPLTGRLERAVADGELPEGTDVGMIIDGLEGSLVMHLLIAPRGATNKELAADLERYVTDIVDVAMTGLLDR